ncbi:MAG: DUF6807 family protein [Opitutales bacterium]
MEVQVDGSLVRFRAGKAVAGEYVLDDRFKPYFRTLCTPAGHNVTVVSPGDHRHHKGLMYALCCEDLNFWEEDPGEPHCGVQSIEQTRTDGAALTQQLLWRAEDGGRQTYREQRTIALSQPDAGRFVWEWTSRRESLRAHRLVKSPWSMEAATGRRVNYHGLGIRLPWVWALGNEAFSGVEVDGQAVPTEKAHGSSGPRVGFWGLIDGYWKAPVAAVSFEQTTAQGFTWFVLKNDIPYLALGPSNAEEIDVAEGAVFEEQYRVVVEDRESRS